MKKVAVTGTAVICGCAQSPSELWQILQNPPPPADVAQIHHHRHGAPGTLAVRRVSQPLSLPEPPLFRRQQRLDRCAKLALAAAAKAWENAGLEPATQPPRGQLPVASGPPGHAPPDAANLKNTPAPPPHPPPRRFRYPGEDIAVLVGSARGPVETWLALLSSEDQTDSAARPSWSASASFASLHGALSALTGATGPCLTLASACASGGHAIALAAGMVASGEVKVALAGGADAPLHPCMLRQMMVAGILDTRPPSLCPCRPFDQSAQGTLAGEGAAFLVLEHYEAALARQTPIHALLTGWGLAGDGVMVTPEASGAHALPSAVRRAMQRAALAPRQVAFVMCHATGNPVHDALEISWLAQWSRTCGTTPLWGGIKPTTGHCLGASPAIEAVVCCEALRHRIAPPLHHLQNPLPECPQGLVCKPGTPLPHGALLSISSGFWGAASALVFERP